jgi:hypothetical protein
VRPARGRLAGEAGPAKGAEPVPRLAENRFARNVFAGQTQVRQRPLCFNSSFDQKPKRAWVIGHQAFILKKATFRLFLRFSKIKQIHKASIKLTILLDKQ